MMTIRPAAAHADTEPDDSGIAMVVAIAVIMLVSDEGKAPEHFSSEATDAQYQEKYNISGAYYFPGIKHAGLYQTITPVNYFRVLMNDYFHTNLALLPDRSFTSVNGVTEVTDRLHHPQVTKSASP